MNEPVLQVLDDPDEDGLHMGGCSFILMSVSKCKCSSSCINAVKIISNTLLKPNNFFTSFRTDDKGVRVLCIHVLYHNLSGRHPV